MYRVTTPTHTFRLPFEAEMIDKLRLTYKQNGKTILEKTEEDVELVDNKIVITLSQKETKSFADKKALVQLRVKIGDKVMASNIIELLVTNVLNDEVI